MVWSFRCDVRLVQHDAAVCAHVRGVVLMRFVLFAAIVVLLCMLAQALTGCSDAPAREPTTFKECWNKGQAVQVDATHERGWRCADQG